MNFPTIRVPPPTSAVCVAAHSGNDAALASLLNGDDGGKTKVNRSDPISYHSPLQHAVIGDHPRCVQVLLSQPKMDVNFRRSVTHCTSQFESGGDGNSPHCTCSFTPLYLAVIVHQEHGAKHSLEIAEMLLNGGADIRPVRQGHSALSKACLGGSNEMVQLIVRARKDTLPYGPAWRTVGHSPHYFAVVGRHLSTLQLLISLNNAYDLRFPDHEQYEIVKAAIDQHSFDAFKLVFTRYATPLCDVKKAHGLALIADAVDKPPSFLEYLLEHGCRPYRTYGEMNGPLTLALDSEQLGDKTIGDEAFALILRHTPRDVVQQYNRRHPSPGQRKRLLRVALQDDAIFRINCDTTSFDRVLLLLNAGFDSDNFAAQTTSTDPDRFGAIRLFSRVNFVYSGSVFGSNVVRGLNIVALAVHRVRDAVQLRKVVRALIDGGANVNASTTSGCNEISPLALLISNSLSAEYAPVCLDLIRAGADLNHCMANSRDRSSYVLFGAVLFGNAAVLSRIFASATTVVDVDLILRDLLAFNLRCCSDRTLRTGIYAAIGRSLRQVLRYVVKRPERRSVCGRIRTVLAVPGDAPDAAVESVWQSVIDECDDAVDSLRQLCRLQIRERLARSAANPAGGLREKVDSLQIPTLIKRYLTFDSEFGEFDEEVYD